MCVFIDGLDEVSEDPDAAIAVIKDMQSANIKVCLSSRPDRCYSDAFDPFAKLRLQDLTKPDIMTYIWDELQPCLPAESEDGITRILNEIARKAQGVFLWVHLVVKALKKGFRNDDSLRQLQIRVELMPSDMEALYAKMLSDIDVAHREEAAQHFQMALANVTDSLLDTTLALCKAFDRTSEMSVQEAIGLCCRNIKRIPAICAGLLEIHQEDKEGGGRSTAFDTYMTLPSRCVSSVGTADISYYERYAHVSFIHRTAIDFLRQSKQGRSFLDQNTKSNFSARPTYVRALLAKVTLLGFPESRLRRDAECKEKGLFPVDSCAEPDTEDRRTFIVDRLGCNFANHIMESVFLEEWKTATAQISLCEDVDRTLATVFQRYRFVSPHSQWFTRWRLFDKETNLIIPVAAWSITTPQSSSRIPFNSTRRESKLFPNVPVDFIGIAATWGLFHYVLARCDLQRNGRDKADVNYLLCCSIQALKWTGYWREIPQWQVQTCNLITYLLDRGGDPNIYIEDLSTTIWMQFLLFKEPWAQGRAQTAATMAAEAFLNAGADIHMKREYRTIVRGTLQSLASPNDNRKLEIYLKFEESALDIVRRTLKYVPEWKTVEEIILAKGGRESYKYTRVTAIAGNSEEPYKILRRLHKKLVTSLNAAHHDHIKHCKFEEWRPLLGKTCIEHLASALDSEGQVSSDDDASSDSDGEEVFYESLEFQPVADVHDYAPSNVEISASNLPTVRNTSEDAQFQQLRLASYLYSSGQDLTWDDLDL